MPDTKQQQAALADDFTALLEGLGALDMVAASADLNRKFDRVYRALSRVDEQNDG